MRQARKRFQLIEYGTATDLAGEISSATGLTSREVLRLIHSASARIGKTLGLTSPSLLSTNAGVRAVDFAGMVRLGPRIELEVIPKFLGASSNGDAKWREDFYFLATLSKHGRLLASERLHASGGAPKDLSTLIARSLTGMYWDNRRRPLRLYRRAHVEDVFIDGEIDPVDLRLPGPDGFAQQIVRYDRNNPFNGLVQAAAGALRPEVSDSSAAKQLSRLIEDLPSKIAPPRRRIGPVPSRSKAWQPVVDLAQDVIDGFGLSYLEGRSTAPGYVLSTWQTWEALLTIAVRLAYGRELFASQSAHILGDRIALPSKKTSRIKVYPDLMVRASEAHPSFLIDAKYKVIDLEGSRVSEADIYEAMAFSQASGVAQVVLLYPKSNAIGAQATGTVTLFEKLQIGSTEILGAYVEVRGISSRQGLTLFSNGLKSGIHTLLCH